MGTRSTKQRVTIKDVAKAAGVSTQTVSRVINDRPDVSPETRRRVKAIITRLDYQPSELARSLIQQRSCTLGVIIAGLQFVGVSQTLNGITEAAEEHDYALLLKELPRFDVTDVEPTIRELTARQVEGILYAAPQVGDNWVHVQASLSEPHPPIIFLKGEPQPGYLTVSIDNQSGAEMAITHLMDSGRRRIGHVAGPQDWWEARQRLHGWQETLRQAGIEPRPDHWAAGNWSSSSGEAAFQKLLESYPEMDSVFAANDQMALAVLSVAHRMGVRIPEDLAVVGFDDLAEAAYFNPPLTTVRQDTQRLGWLAVQKLVERIEEAVPDEEESILIRPELIVRKSA